MRYINSVLGIGIFLLILPFLGFPSVWKTFFILIIGFWMCGMSFSMLALAKAPAIKHKKHTRKLHVGVTHLEPIPEIKEMPVYNNPNEQNPAL